MVLECLGLHCRFVFPHPGLCQSVIRLEPSFEDGYLLGREFAGTMVVARFLQRLLQVFVPFYILAEAAGRRINCSRRIVVLSYFREGTNAFQFCFF